MGSNSDVSVDILGDILNAPKEPSRFTCHPQLSKSTQMGHMAANVCLLQTMSPSHTVQNFILFSLMFHHYILFNVWPKIPPWLLHCRRKNPFTFLLQVLLTQLESHLILDNLETFSIPPSFLTVQVACLCFLVSSLKHLSSDSETALNTLALASLGTSLFQA